MKKLLYYCLLCLPCVLLLTTPQAAHSEVQPDTNYCQEGWAEWQALLQDNPHDEPIQTLYSLRAGLCVMIKSGDINTQEAIDIFEKMRNSVIAHHFDDLPKEEHL